MKELIEDILTGNPPMELRMLMSTEDYDLPYGSWNPYVEQAVELYSGNPGLPLEIVKKVVEKISHDYEKEVKSYGRAMLA